VAGDAGLRSDLQRALLAAMKARDPIMVAALRTALSAIDNAEAAELTQAPAIEHGAIAGGVAGLGAGEVPRREISESQLREIVLAEVARWQASAADYERARCHDQATRLEAEVAALTRFLACRDP
jgi:uncharacterized protein YqeY